jgi:Fringe-like
VSRSSFVCLRFLPLCTLIILAYVVTSRAPTSRLRVNFLPSFLAGLENSCMAFASGENVVVMVKTGASEAAEKVPAQMATTLRCAKHVLHFSDLEQDIGQYHLHDALDNVPASFVENNPEFDLYKKQKALWRDKGDISELRGAKDPESPHKLAAWTLDKYKFLYVLEKTWVQKPDMDWYVLIDADSYIFWPTLLTWLSTMDPTKKSYFGSGVFIGEDLFAHGGSGIVMSRAAVYEIVVAHQGTAARWDLDMRAKCCGDLVLGLAFKEFGIELQNARPFMSGETPSTLPFGPGTPEYMCTPALTMHHLTPADMRELVEFERRRLRDSVCDLPLGRKEL